MHCMARPWLEQEPSVRRLLLRWHLHALTLCLCSMGHRRAQEDAANHRLLLEAQEKQLAGAAFSSLPPPSHTYTHTCTHMHAHM